MKKRDIIIGKGVSGAYYADKFLPDNLPGYPGYHIPKLFERGFSYRDISYIFNREASTATIKRWHFLYIKKYGL